MEKSISFSESDGAPGASSNAVEAPNAVAKPNPASDNFRVPNKQIGRILALEPKKRCNALHMLAIEFADAPDFASNRVTCLTKYGVGWRRFCAIRELSELAIISRDRNGGNAARGGTRYARETRLDAASPGYVRLSKADLSRDSRTVAFLIATLLSPKPQALEKVGQRIGVRSRTTLKKILRDLAPSYVPLEKRVADAPPDCISWGLLNKKLTVARLGTPLPKLIEGVKIGTDRSGADRNGTTQHKSTKAIVLDLKTPLKASPKAASAGGSDSRLKVKDEASPSQIPGTISVAEAKAKFAEFWNIFPDQGDSYKPGKTRCEALFVKIVTGKHRSLKATAEYLISSARTYAKKKLLAEKRYVKSPIYWLRDEGWTQFSPPGPPAWWKDDAAVAAMTEEKWESLIREKAAGGIWPIRELGYPPSRALCIVPNTIIEKMNLLEIFPDDTFAADAYRVNKDGSKRPNVFVPLPAPPPRQPDPVFEIGERVTISYINGVGIFVGTEVIETYDGPSTYLRVEYPSGEIKKTLAFAVERAPQLMMVEPSPQFEDGERVEFRDRFDRGTVIKTVEQAGRPLILVRFDDGQENFVLPTLLESVPAGKQRQSPLRGPGTHSAPIIHRFDAQETVIHAEHGWGTVQFTLLGGAAHVLFGDGQARYCPNDEIEPLGYCGPLNPAALFKVGDRVQNSLRGVGVVEQVLKTGKHYVVKFPDGLAMGDESELAPAQPEVETA